MAMGRTWATKVAAAVTTSLVATSLALIATVVPAAADASITSTGPLSPITTSSTLNCRVPSTFGEHFFSGTACGTFVALPSFDGTSLFGPASVPSGPATFPYSLLGHSGVGGSGTATDPYSVQTYVSLPQTDLRITQIDSYVVGEEGYRTDITISNLSDGVPYSGRLYRAADCSFQDESATRDGVGQIDSSSVTCVIERISEDFHRKELRPLTSGASMQEATSDGIWRLLSAGSQLNGTANPDSHDAAIAVDWAFNIPPLEERTYSLLTTLSDSGYRPLLSTVGTTSTIVGTNDDVTYNVTVSNLNGFGVDLAQIYAKLPSGFSYVPSSTSGVTVADPQETAVGVYEWDLSAVTVGANSSVSLGFAANAGSVGTQTITVGGYAPPAPVVPAKGASIDVYPRFTVNDASVSEGNDGLTPLTFQITLDQPAPWPVTVHLDTIDDTAVAGEDYNGDSSAVVIGQFQSSTSYTVNVIGDTTPESDEQLTLESVEYNNAFPDDAVGNGSILNDDIVISPVKVTIGDTSVAEDGGGDDPILYFTVSADRNIERAVTVYYETSSNTATSGTDFEAATGSVTLPPGTSSVASIGVRVTDDLLDENDETVTVTLTGADGAVVGDPSSGTGTILDDDASPNIAALDAASTEGSPAAPGTARVLLQLDAPSGRDVTVPLSTIDGTARSTTDYVARTGSVVIPAGSTSVTTILTFRGDHVDEPDETYSLQLGTPTNAGLERSTATVTIRDDDPPALRIADVRVPETTGGTTTATLGVTLSSAATGTVSVSFTTVGIDAGSPRDFTATSGTLSIPQGSVTGSITVPVAGDALDEVDERFKVVLSGLSGGATLADGTGIVTIVDDDLPPVVSVGATRQLEGDCSCDYRFAFPVTLSTASGKPVKVTFRTAGVTASPNRDFTSVLGGTVTIPAGATTGYAYVDILGDLFHEQNEQMRLTIESPVNATLSAATSAIGTIIDEEGPFTVRVDDGWQLEGSSDHRVVVRLNAVPLSGEVVTVAVATAAGTATSADFTAIATTLRFTASTGSVISLPLAVRADTRIEDDEHLFARASSASANAVISDSEGVLVIVDDD